jgi:predicted membrane-bound spermidine synthase
MAAPASAYRNPVPFLLFVLSGFAGLLYQIVWLRLAFSSFGVITPVLSVVVSTFMLGLSLGSWLGGRAIGPLTRATRLPAAYLYAAAELLIGVGALVVPRLFSAGQARLLSLGGMDSGPYLLISGLYLGASILPWCVLMGTTFPFMIAHLRDRQPADTNSFSYLYLANVIGAMLGTIVTAGVLIELIGLRNCLWIGAGLNLLIAGIALAWGSRRAAPVAAPAPATAVAAAAAVGTPISPAERLTLVVLFLTGFCSMAMEVVWTRAFTPVLLTTIYSFASILVTYLLATWVGSYLYRRHLREGRVLSMPVVIAWLAAFAFLPILNDPRLHTHQLLDAALIWISLVPFCGALGYLTPQLVDRYSSGDPKRVGSAYAINIVGSILGPLLAGYLLLPTFGVRTALILLALPFPGLLIVLGIRRALPKRVFATAGAAAVVLAALAIGVVRCYDDPAQVGQGVVRRDHTATVICQGEGMRKRLFVNGVSITWLTPVTKVMAHLPLVALQSPPRSAAIICFGMGTTFRSLATWPIEVTAIELVPSVKESFGYFFADADTVLRPPRRQIVVDDGRRFLSRTDQRFDVITLDPPPPVAAAGSSLLYSTEFYDVVKSRLAEGGILHQWFPGGEELTLEAVTMAITGAFPHVRVYRSIENSGFHFLASMTPIHVPDEAGMIARLPEAARRDLVEWSDGAELGQVVREILSRELPLTAVRKYGKTTVLTDDRPFNEYCLLRRSWNLIRGRDERAY